MAKNELIDAKEAALSWLKPASREVLKWFRNDVNVERKADQSPVTIADRKAEEILRTRIKKEFPKHGIIGEEFGEEDAGREWVWTVDPIDGTRSFIRGLPLFSILLSLLHHGEPVVGIICLPALGETAWAVRGQGAYCDGKRIRVSSHTTVKGSTLGTADVYCFREKKAMRFYQALQKEAALTRIYPDAFGHLMAIRGSLDAMVDPWAYIWDFAPIKVMAEEAGGLFENFKGNKGDIREGTALVGNPALVRNLKRLINKS